jgi:DNA-binding MarR family transcriptional regulator
MAHADNVQALIEEVRLADERLRLVEEALCSELGLTPAMRGVLEVLAVGGRRTVPQIARVKGVTRQHVQALVDAAWERGLCQFAPNPDHARSPLVTLSGKGQAVVETLAEVEQSRMGGLAASVTTDVPAALAVLRRLNAALLRRL